MKNYIQIASYREMLLPPLSDYVCKGKMCRRESQQHHTPVRLPQLASLLRAVLLFCSNEWMFCIETKMLKRKVLIGYHVFIISPPTCVWWQSASVSFLCTVIIIIPNLDFVTTTSLDWGKTVSGFHDCWETETLLISTSNIHCIFKECILKVICCIKIMIWYAALTIPSHQ